MYIFKYVIRGNEKVGGRKGGNNAGVWWFFERMIEIHTYTYTHIHTGAHKRTKEVYKKKKKKPSLN